MKRRLKVPLPRVPKKLGMSLAEKRLVRDAMQAVIDLDLPDDPFETLGVWPDNNWEKIHELHARIEAVMPKITAAAEVADRYRPIPKPKKPKVKK